MAYVVTNNPWTSQYSIGVGTETPLGGGSEKTIHLSDGGGGYATVYVTNSANTVRSIFGMQSSANLGIVGTQTNTPFAIFTNDTDRMRITSAGLVGIGTSAPAKPLHVYSTNTSANAQLKLTNSGTVPSGYLGMFSSTFYINSGGTYNSGWTLDGSVGVAAVELTSFDGGSQINFATASSNTTPAQRMTIKSTGNVGIGTDTPDTVLDATLGLSVYSSTGRAGIAIAGNTTTADEVLGRLCFTNNNSTNAGNKRLAYISGIRGTTNNSAYLEFGTANDALGTQRMIITQSGGVGIGTSTPGTYKLNVNGTFYSAGSSLEYKTDIETFDADTDKLMQLRPVTYQYKDEYKHLGKELKSGTQIGLIAEEVAEVFPELAILKEDEDGVSRVRNVDYEKLSILLLSEVQKLRKEVNELLKSRLDKAGL
jgi:hypothetical protein